MISILKSRFVSFLNRSSFIWFVLQQLVLRSNGIIALMSFLSFTYIGVIAFISLMRKREQAMTNFLFQPTFTCSKLTIETLAQGLKYVSS